MTGLRWLGVHRHQVRNFPAPFLMVLQHPVVEGPTRIVAPVIPAGPGRQSLLLPRVTIGGVPHTAVLLNMAAVSARQIGPSTEATVDEDAMTTALDARSRGYPVGLPLR